MILASLVLLRSCDRKLLVFYKLTRSLCALPLCSAIDVVTELLEPQE